MTRDSSITPAETLATKQVRELGVDEQSMLVVSNIFRVSNLVRNYTERHLLNEYGLTFSGFTVLWVLWVNGKTESRALAEESGVSKSTLTGIVNTLEKNALVTRKPHAHDGRRVFVHTTAKGRATMKKVFPVFNSIEALFTSDLSVREKDALIRSLRIILHTLDAENG
ncbi:MAG: MarR family winged helix-turn-helix transcriptional regulator [Pseudomonadota bacterium]